MLALFDFSSPGAARWVPVNDVVMGGVSSGELQPTDLGTAVFSGEVSFENNGGFSSIRSRPSLWDLRPYAGLELRVRGDGRQYKINLRCDGSAEVLHRFAFATTAGAWTTVSVPFDALEPTVRGRIVDAPSCDLSRVRDFGLMVADGREGPFRLELAWLRAVPAR